MAVRGIWPTGLEESSQRRLILRAVKECAPDRLGEYRGKQFCFAQVDTEQREYLCLAGLLCWLVFPLLALIDVVLSSRIRKAVAQNWEQWLANPDLDCDLWVSLGTVRRILKKLPRNTRKEVKPIYAELKHVEGRWQELTRSLETVNQALSVVGGPDLTARRDELMRRIDEEADESTRAAMSRSLASVEGQLQTRNALETWKRRLHAAQDECLESLAHMTSHLTLLATAEPSAKTVPLSQATERLQTINHNLTALQEASEEVLQLQTRG